MDNYTKFPNDILEALIRYRLPGRRHLVVMLYIVRNTYGWHKAAGDHISVQKMAAEIGIRRPTLSGIVNDLAKMGLIEVKRSSGHPSFIRVLPPAEWEQPVTPTVLSPTEDCPIEGTSRTRDTYMSRTGDRGMSPTGDRYMSRTGDTPKKEKEILKKDKESVFSSFGEESDEWLTIDELVSRRQANGKTNL